MEKTNINKSSLIITIVAIVGLAGLIIFEQHHLSRFVPTPPPVADATPSIPSGQTAPTSNPSVCYYLNQPSKGGLGNDIEYFKLTIASGTTATGELGIAYAEKDAVNGALNGSISADTANTGGYVFTGQYMNSQEGIRSVRNETVNFDPAKAIVNDGGNVAIPRVDCGKYDSLKQVQSN
jgi:hypothetical protein